MSDFSRTSDTNAVQDSTKTSFRERVLGDLKILDHLVRIASIAVIILLAMFFFCVITNISSIHKEVETVKDGSQPISVAAGHLETYLVRLETVVEHHCNTQPTESDTHRFEGLLTTIDERIREQLDLIDPAQIEDSTQAARFKDDYELLSSRLNVFMLLCWQPSISLERTSAYADAYLYPMIDELLLINTAILNETSADVNRMYDTVNQAISNMVVLSGIVVVGVVIMIVIFAFLLKSKSRREDELRNNLEKALVSARSVNEAKSAFLSNMSHDIRTPMNAIIGLTTIANENINDTLRVKQCLTRIATSSQHLLSLINDVLDMNKIDSGKVKLTDEEFSLSDFISEIVTIIQGQPNIKRLHSEVIINDVRHERLIGDAMRLRQVILNLASNAIKYTNEGDLMFLEVTEEPQTRPGWANFTFIVKDTGIGMKKEFLRNIFEPFERERNDFTNFTEGTGLGMSITKNLIDLMGGTIEVESDLGIGTTVTIHIALKIADGAPTEKDAEEAARIASFKGLRALIVDGNNLVMNNTVNILRSFGMDAMGTTSAEEAIEIAVKAREDFRAHELDDKGNPVRHYDVIIVDEQLAEMRGTETIQKMVERLKLREDEKERGKIILSSYDVNEVKEEANAAGIRKFIAKPLFRSRLIGALEKALNPEEEVEVLTSAGKETMHVGGRVLVVEDNEINMEIASVLISERGPEVDEAFNGLEAVTMVSNAEDGYYDLIFMDWRMPYMDGIEATKAINKFLHEHGRKHIPIVAMTANAFDSDREAVFEAGMDDFMAKPINLKELEAMLKKYLGGQMPS